MAAIAQRQSMYDQQRGLAGSWQESAMDAALPKVPEFNEAPEVPEVSARAVRTIGIADLRWALAAGWQDYRAKRGELLMLPVIYPLMGIVASAIAFNSSLFALVFPLIGGFALVGPVAATGFYELARRRELGDDPSWWHFLDPIRGAPRQTILALAAMLAIVFLLWLGAAQAIHGSTLAVYGAPTPEKFAARLFTTAEGWRMIAIGNIVGAGFALVTLAIATFSFPMAIDHAQRGVPDPLTAILTSVAVFRRNLLITMLWGAIVALILFAAALPLFIGLMVAMPVLGYATWHLYTRAVER
jgi:uncharacterized membrane protein